MERSYIIYPCPEWRPGVVERSRIRNRYSTWRMLGSHLSRIVPFLFRHADDKDGDDLMSKSGSGFFCRPLLLALVLLGIVFLTAGVSGAVQEGPANPAFIHYISEKQNEVLSLPDVSMPGMKGRGLIPSPVNYAQVRDVPISVSLDGAPAIETALPASFDLRTSSKVSPVKNQGTFGTCWAHAALASLESTMMPLSPAPDFSEKNLANNAGFDRAIPDGGGNALMAAAALTGWRGPVSEANDRYPRGNQWVASPYFTTARHVQEVIIFPLRTNRASTASIKTALTTYGAVMTGFFWDSSFYNTTSRSYYQPNTSANPSSGSGHGVTIIGWNNTYPRTNFKRPYPAANGAWLVKNSWGTAWGNSGYFWVSYYDKYFASAVEGDFYYDSALFRGEAVSNYNGIYSYDKLGWTTSYYTGSTPETGSYASVYTATSAAKIAAVGLYTTDVNVPATIRIYRNPTSGPVTGGTLAYTCTTTFANMGYHTVKFPVANQVPVSANQKFSVVVTVTNPSYDYYIPVERNYADYTRGIVSYTGQTYALDEGTWTDWYNEVPNSHVILKAYTVAA